MNLLLVLGDILKTGEIFSTYLIATFIAFYLLAAWYIFIDFVFFKHSVCFSVACVYAYEKLLFQPQNMLQYT